MKSDLQHCIQLELEQYFSKLNGEKASKVYQMVLCEIEPTVLRVVLDFSNHNHSEAARILGMSRATLKKKIDRYDLTNNDKTRAHQRL